MKHLLTIFIILSFFLFLGAECSTDPPEGTCLDNTIAVIDALKDTHILVIVEGDSDPDSRHVECFYWEDDKWKCGYWTGARVVEKPQEFWFNASIYNYEEYLDRVRTYGWR